MDKNESDQDKLQLESQKQERGNPYKPVQIYDTSCNKIRQARNFKVSSFEEHDKNGILCMKKSVEFYIVGNNRTWKMFIPFDEFIEANPHVELPGEPK